MLFNLIIFAFLVILWTQRGWITFRVTVFCIGLYPQTEYSRKYLVPSVVLNMVPKNWTSVCWSEFCYEIRSVWVYIKISQYFQLYFR